MTVADDLEAARAALVMINPAPYNAEAPPAALVGEITPTELHYVRSNFAVPEHDGTLEIGGAVGRPTTLTLDDLRAMPAHEHTVTLECAGNGRLEMRPLPTGEPWGDFAVSTARWTGALLHEVLARGRARRRDGVEVLAQGADHGPYHLQAILPETDQDNLTFTRSLPLAQATDPASGILIAYEMNGQPLGPRPRRPVPADRPALVRRRVREVAQTARRPHRAVHRRVPDRPLHLPVARPAPRARLPDAGTRPDHRPGTRLDHRRSGTYTVRGKAWSGTGPITRVDVSLTGEGDWQPAQLEPPEADYHWQDWTFTWDATNVGRHTLRARATDAAGNVQPDVPPWNRLGYGNNAIEVIYVDRR